MNSRLRERWQDLQSRLRSLACAGERSGLAVAFSGGLDSRFLTHAALLLGLDVLALHFTGPQCRAVDEQSALEWLGARGVEHKVIRAEVLALPEVRLNSLERCYHCKRFAFGLLRAEADKDGKAFCDGSLRSDAREYRPGARALAELGVHSPLAEAGLDKEDVRSLGAALELDNAGQAGQSCLLTRFDYGLEATPARLRLLERAEFDLAALLGEIPFRLRLLKQSGPKLPEPLPELHVQLAPQALQSADELPCRLRAALDTHGLEAARIVALPNLSGFFDREREIANTAIEGAPPLQG